VRFSDCEEGKAALSIEIVQAYDGMYFQDVSWVSKSVPKEALCASPQIHSDRDILPVTMNATT